MSNTSIRRSAVMRGLNFIHGQTLDANNFREFGFDCLFSFLVSAKSKYAEIREFSVRVGRELSELWARDHSALGDDADADTVAEFVFAVLGARSFGVKVNGLHRAISAQARKFVAQDYYWFDPQIEPPCDDMPEVCDCGTANARGARVCSGCSSLLRMMSRYEVWLDALIRSYIGKQFRIRLGRSYDQVIKWLPVMKPYPPNSAEGTDYIWAIYAITHIVYTLNEYHSYSIDPRLLPSEYDVLIGSLDGLVQDDDAETVGEVVDSLKALGVSNRNLRLRRAVDYLLSCQNLDGSWGGPAVDDPYERYHTTLTALNGLDDYAWQGSLESLPKAISSSTFRP